MKAERLAELREKYGIQTTADNEAIARWADVVVIAVKPQIVDRILAPIAAALTETDLVVSIAAGVPLEAIEARLPADARVDPRHAQHRRDRARRRDRDRPRRPRDRATTSRSRARSSRPSAAASCSTSRCSTR